ncbi:MAG TPA: NYN domain-containing protein [Anaerolineales bacterium]|nr:NYN domain-containing protein [Anaerolineales bacterium]
MPYLIDGHNLIGALPGHDLRDPDDEVKLVRVLRAFCAGQRTRITVYFDRGAPGRSNPPAGGGVTVRFVRPPATADSAIVRHLEQVGREAPNWIVVSSDRSVAQAARRAGARALSSGEFARLLFGSDARPTQPEKPDAPVSAEDVEAWEDLFRRRPSRPGGQG